MDTDLIQPEFDTELEGFQFLGRGPEAIGPAPGWKRNDSLYFRCVKCGTMVHSIINEYFNCECGAMFVDVDYHRFGSNYGDQNILVYKKVKK